MTGFVTRQDGMGAPPPEHEPQLTGAGVAASHRGPSGSAELIYAAATRAVRLAAWLARPQRRQEWREEWLAELWHRRAALSSMSAWNANTAIALLLRTLGTLPHAASTWTRSWSFDAMLQELRYSVRSLIKRPAFTLIAALTLAIGIGANTTIFSVVNTVLLRPLTLHDPAGLMMIWGRDATTGAGAAWASFPDYLDFLERNESFEDIALWRSLGGHLTGDAAEPQRVKIGYVTANLFELIGVEAKRGRVILLAEDVADGELVVMLGSAIWRSRYGSDPGVVGAQIRVDGVPHTVVGVMPDGFRFPEDVGIWVSLTRQLTSDGESPSRGMHGMRMMGRLRGEITEELAQQDVSSIAGQLAVEYPRFNSDRDAWVMPVYTYLFGEMRPVLLLLFGAVGFVLLIACANFANLLLVRGADRDQELSIRAAIGAGRGRLIRQLVLESTILALVGGAAGALLSVVALRAIVAAAGSDVPRLIEARVDLTTLAFLLMISLLTGGLFGLLPALKLSRVDVADRLRGQGRASTGAARTRRLRTLLVVAEVALALVLVVGAGLLVNSFWRVASVEPGYASEGVLTVDLGLPLPRYPEPSAVVEFYERLTERVRGLPGVAVASAAYSHPVNPGWTTSFELGDRDPFPPGAGPEANFRPVTPGYFEGVGIELTRGRTFTPVDGSSGSGAVIINEAFANALFRDAPNTDPIGVALWHESWFGDEYPSEFEIVGVVADVKFRGLERGSAIAMYFPHSQKPMQEMTLVARVAGDPMAIVPAVRDIVGELDPELPLERISTLQGLLDDSVGPRRFLAQLLGIFALAALGLAAIGIYGVMAYSVVCRTHEIGVRLALGAEPASVRDLVLRQGLATALSGVAIGLAGALYLARFLDSLVFGISSSDPLTLVVVSSLLLSVAMLAVWVPARRATRVDPMLSLRPDR